jgi:hypothetical protein
VSLILNANDNYAIVRCVFGIDEKHNRDGGTSLGTFDVAYLTGGAKVFHFPFNFCKLRYSQWVIQ